MANSPSPIGRHIARLLKEDPPRAKSLCVSLLGDALACHGGAIWLGGIIELLEPLGINERLLRTSVFRLVAQGWLQAERHGRRSLYQLSEQGLRHTAHASQRIYVGPAADWNGEWTLVALPRLGNNGLAERTELRRELAWEGFGMIAPGLFAHPQADARAAHDILEKLGIPDKALVLSGRDLAGAGGLPIASLAPQCWSLDALAGQYRHFSRQFGPLEKLLDEPLDPADAFATRMLLLHTWRRIVLHDPQLPVPMLPERWPGHAARALCGQIYWKLFDASEQHLDAVAGRDNERYTPLSPAVYTRFGGRPAA
ncbi:phenylacetic acid degradation operon negative regulatory protein PaaX [Bordetella petrii]|uniref:Phenylacetic acid degradation operon negative regulatory protein n=1 Tax=Bordetella petrii (strain ATCC BAA-461 / DSM 12804 / CCUG 43448 / CIP 107267 / Se-1111R) TaxID=340100 RepID=A9IJP6_BORPD|nr:phenylacetic acid degradation operon negative regulatory protein PaaX [Bordetella petrii]CAP42262.1 phenylacetic acid degradation operon negative regulatory protein [Bordetella petrii]